LLLDNKKNATHLLETFTEMLPDFDSVENVDAGNNSFQLKIFSLFIAAIH